MTGVALPHAPKLNRPTIVETQALRLLADGFDHGVVAHKLGITPGAVHSITSRMRRRLGAKNTPQLIYMAVKRGWIK